VSVEEGADPRQAVLVAFGGAGGLHAVRLAARLGIGKVLIPPLSGVFSALGLLLAERRADTARTVMTTPGDPGLSEAVASVGREAGASYRQMFGSGHRTLSFTADVRYRGQAHELEVAFSDVELIAESFEEAHRERFGFNRPGEPMEVVNLRAAASAPAPLTWDRIPRPPTRGEPVADNGVWQRQTLPAGFEITGAGVIVEDNSAVLVEEGSRVVVLDDGTLEMTI
jgi:N-methylhydantoinase A